MSDDPVRAFLDALEDDAADPLPALAYLAGDGLDLDEDERNGAVRRALFVHASGGPATREPGVDDPAVKGLAADIYSDARRAALGREVDALIVATRGLPRVSDAAIHLAREPELAWRLFALSLLAAELTE